MAGKKEKRPSWLTYAIAVLRRASYRWPSMNEAMTKARRSRGIYECADCGKHFGRKEVQRDHKSPVVPVTGWDNLEQYAQRLLCEEGGISVLCKGCHKKKTKTENEQRRRIEKESNGEGSREVLEGTSRRGKAARSRKRN